MTIRHVQRWSGALVGALLACALNASAQERIAERAEWALAGKDYANTRFSELVEIEREESETQVHVLDRCAGGPEAAPVVVGSTMYIVTPYPNVVYALDLAKPGAPAKWKFEPKPLAASQGAACCDVVNRGVAHSRGRVYFNTLDAQTIALDARTGKEVCASSSATS